MEKTYSPSPSDPRLPDAQVLVRLDHPDGGHTFFDPDGDSSDARAYRSWVAAGNILTGGL